LKARETLTGLLWISPWLMGFVAFMALPLAMSLYSSFTDDPLIEKPLWTGLDNFRALAQDPVFHTVLWNTVVYAAFSIPLSTIVALAVAALLTQKIRGVGFYRAAIFVPAIVPAVASAMIWYWLFNGELGLINQAIAGLGRMVGMPGLRGPSWLKEHGWAMAALVLVSLWNVGQSVVIYLAAMQEVPRSLYEAASIDGAGPIRRWFSVTLPGVSPVILFNTITGVINTWQVFAVPYIMTEGGPGRSTLFYSMYLYQNAFVYQKMGYASALAWIQFLIIVALTGLTFLLSRNLVHQKAA
jgi:multiple sugar transport system permease protein